MRTFKSISKFILRGFIALLTSTCLCRAANIFWTGPTNTFTHAANTSTADELTTNHVGADSVNNVWLTRGTAQPLYNAAAESSWNGSTSPVNTLWVLASGSLSNAASLTYDTFDNVVGQPGNSPGRSVGKTFFVKIVSDNIYLQLKLTAWGNNNGGSFQYQRTTPAVAPPPTPSVTITNPASGAVFGAPANIVIGASASVSSGTVTNVQFFTNNVSLASVRTAPFTLAANNLGAGSYTLTAVATAGGISATSAPVAFGVLPTPAVTITNPVAGTVFAAPANVSIGANASVSSGTVTNVQFFTNGVSLASITTAPFTLTANNLGAGSYTLTAVATAGGISATSAPVAFGVLPTPAVTITNPVGGAVFAAPANVSIGANASVSSGTVTNVQFFTNGVSLASITTAPFTLTANNLGAGSYTLTAVATAGGISATSAPVAFGVLPTPAVTITNPVAGTVFAAPANVNIGASASVSNGTVTNVQFFTNGVSLASVTNAPFTLTASNLAAGAYTLTAVATASGILATSTPVNITVTSASAPTVSLTNPPNGAVFAAPANLKLGASASPGSGPVTNVQFFANGTNLLGSVTVAPLTTISSNTAAGAYTLTAVATAGGISATSAPVNISVVNPVSTTVSSSTVSGGVFSFSYTASPGLSYVVQTSSNLVNWLSLATNTTATSPVSFSDPATNEALFYRIGLLPNP